MGNLFMGNMSTLSSLSPLLGIVGIVIIALIVVKVKNNVWQTRRYQDDFGNFTKNFYIALKKNGYGHFSNSATSGSLMEFCALIDKGEVTFRFWDYCEYPLKNTYSDRKTLDFKCQTNNGVQLDTVVTVDGYSGDFELDVEDSEKFIEMLKNSKKLKCIMEGGNLRYVFEVKNGNFKKLYNKLQSK